MLKKYMLPALAGIGLLACVAWGAPRKSAAPRSPGKTASQPTSESALGLMLTVDRTTIQAPAGTLLQKGAVLQATLTFFNETNAPLQFSLRGKPDRWQILDAQDQVVWDDASGRVLPHNMRLVTLLHDQLVYHAQIPLQKQDGTPLPPGRYILRGAISGGVGATASLGFTVIP